MKKTALLLLFCASLLHAQTQADLERQVQAEQWADAAKTVTTLLQASPADATLKSYQAEISKHLAPATTNQVAAASVPAAMAVDDKIALRTVERVARDASASKDADEQKKLCHELLTQSAGLAQRYPDQLKVWLFRAQAALVLDDATAGGEAGQQIKQLMNDQSGDAVLDVLAELNRKGWLDTAKMAKLKAASEKFAALKGKDMKLPLGSGVELELVWVPAGYWVGKYEVTQAEYTAVMGSNPAKFRGERLPVEQVSWNNAMEFCKKVTEQARSAGWLPLDWQVTLPTEKQWEYFLGDAELKDAICPEGQLLKSTAPVGTLGANQYGLYDVQGNVSEWCADWYDSEQKDRVLRGVSWSFYSAGMAASYRIGCAPVSRNSSAGFRVVLVEVAR